MLNVVGGWNRREFEMSGIDMLGHEQRHACLAEWLTVLKRLWTAQREFDYDSEHFHMKGGVSRSQPKQQPHIPIMNAGLSPSGMKFAAEHSDIGLIAIAGSRPKDWANQVNDYKSLARNRYARELKVWTNVSMTLKDDRVEAEAYLARYSEEYLDREAAEMTYRSLRTF